MSSHHSLVYTDTYTFKMFSLSILLLPLLTGAYASNVLDLDPSNFDSIIGQGKPGLVELCVVLPDLLRSIFDASLASHHGGTFLSSRCIITLKCSSTADTAR
jgi:hypothetical protein